jgi:hypothetical protein
VDRVVVSARDREHGRAEAVNALELGFVGVPVDVDLTDIPFHRLLDLIDDVLDVILRKPLGRVSHDELVGLDDVRECIYRSK